MPRSIKTLLAALLVSLAWATDAAAVEPFKQSLADLHAIIKPQADEEAWAKIPWMTSLWEARKKAAAAGKPILLWEMDGHPLGCT